MFVAKSSQAYRPLPRKPRLVPLPPGEEKQREDCEGGLHRRGA